VFDNGSACVGEDDAPLRFVEALPSGMLTGVAMGYGAGENGVRAKVMEVCNQGRFRPILRNDRVITIYDEASVCHDYVVTLKTRNVSAVRHFSIQNLKRNQAERKRSETGYENQADDKGTTFEGGIHDSLAGGDRAVR
ncbi:MAG: hypothetical protein ACI8UZ_001484, partial [Akkermansiaceae bacterium]